MFFSLVLNGVTFLGDKIFPISLDVIYMHGFMLFLGLNCCAGLIFVAFMDETRGASIDSVNPPEIQTSINKPSLRLSPQLSSIAPSPRLTSIEPSLKNHLRNKLADRY